MAETSTAAQLKCLSAQRFRLENALIDPAANTIVTPAGTSRLEPRVMAVLAHLAAHAGGVVTRADLLDAVWGECASDEALTQAVSHLRRVLGDDARRPKIIETIPKRGYRLLAAVEPVEAAPPDPAKPVAPDRPPLPSPLLGAFAHARRIPLAASTLIGAGLLTAISAASSPREAQHIEEVRVLADAIADREATAAWLAEHGLEMPELAPGEYRRIQQTTTDEAGAQRVIEFELIGPEDGADAEPSPPAP